MRDVLSGSDQPSYLDKRATDLLKDARREFRRLGFDRQYIFRASKGDCLVATWAGTIKTSTLALALRYMGFGVTVYPGFLDVNCSESTQSVEASLEVIANWAPVPTDEVLSAAANLMTEKFHPYLSLELLREDAASSRIDLDPLPDLARSLIEGQKKVRGHNGATERGVAAGR